jgi:hypothetical protein
MCELTVVIKAPYNITLLIDGQCCIAQKIGEYKIILEPDVQHKLEIRVEKHDFKKEKFFDKAVSPFKLKGRYTDSFDDVFYKADFTLSKKNSTSKVVFEYKKFTTLNFHIREIPVAYIQISKKSKIDIINEKKSVFKNKKDFLIHFVRHRWIEVTIAVIVVAVVLIVIFRTFFENRTNLYKQYEFLYGKSFATNPFERIIEGSVALLFWVVYWTVGNILFIRRSLKISKWTKDEDDKSAFLYKMKFFI